MLPWGDIGDDGAMSPRLTHFAINTDDVDATQVFYGSVFGWQFQEYGPPGFVQILDETGTAPMGAIQQRRQLLDAPTRRDSSAPSALTTSTPLEIGYSPPEAAS